MTAPLWLSDVASYSLQVTIWVALGAVLARIFRLRATTATLAYWQALLLGCLMLPVLQPWRSPAPARVPEARFGTLVGRGDGETVTTPATPKKAAMVSEGAERAVLVTLAGGVAARGLWLLLGLWTLRRLRRDASPLSPERVPLEAAQRQVGVRARAYLSTRTQTPVTFGLRRPVILLPPTVLEMDAQAQQAILCHELLHVRRRDCLWSVLEEVVRALLWFHPAVWWLIGRIHLAREQVVAVVGLTRSRERYVEALLAVARAKTQVGFVPAPLFLRRGRLKQRVAELFRETPMTTRRLLFCLATSAGLLVVAAGGAARLFPLEASAPDREAATVDPRMRGDKPEARAAAERLEREIEELQKALKKASASAEQKERWQRELLESARRLAKVSDDRLVMGTVFLKGRPGEADWDGITRLLKEIEAPAMTAERRAVLDKSLEERGVWVSWNAPEGLEPPISGTLVKIQMARVSESASNTLRERLDVHEGDVIDDEIAARVRETVTGLDEHYRAQFHRVREDGLILLIVGP